MLTPTDEKKALALRALRDAKEAVDFRRRSLSSAFRKAVNHRLSKKLSAATERELTEALIPFFVEQGRSMAGRLRKVGEKGFDDSEFEFFCECGNSWSSSELGEKCSHCGKKSKASSDSAAKLVRRIFDPKEWREDLTNRALPILARRMGEAAVAHLMSLGIDPRRKGGEKSVKASTAAEWVEENAEDWEALEEAFAASGASIGILNELPQRMKDDIAKRLSESFAQDYWDGVSEATMGNAETVLRQGIAEGQSIHDMAVQLREYFEEGGFRYARARSENIARTESGNALNGARKDSVAQLQEELGDRVPIKQSWLSVLGNTTRAEHADLDGVPEDENGMWNLGGVDIPWPGHIDLPPSDRCNCQCSLTIEFGMREDEAQQLIDDYWERVEDFGEKFLLDLWRKHLPGQHDQSTHGSGGGGEGEGGEGTSWTPGMSVDQGLVNKRLSEVADSLKGLKNERLVVLNGDGTIHSQIDGNENSVSMSSSEREAISGRITIHNHPDQGYSFSSMDVAGAIADGELEMHVVGAGGQRYKMDLRSTAKLDKGQREKLAAKVKRAYSKEDRASSERTYARMQEIGLKPFAPENSRRAVALSVDDAWRSVAEKFGFEYSSSGLPDAL